MDRSSPAPLSGAPALPGAALLSAALLAAALLAPAPLLAQADHAHGAHGAHGARGGDVGDVDFGVSCARAVRDDFDRAVALLHHMMYDEARAAFGAVAEEDPGCAMAHWGVAMTLFQPLWPTRPDADARRRGWEAVERARALGPGSDRERALVEATAAFFRDPEAEEWWPRIERWAGAMEEAREAHPDDAEVTAFWALSELAEGQVAEDRMAHHERAASALHALHHERPGHPGATHYTIHANDVTGRAGEAPAIVESYDDIAPTVPHALHMPSHIYVRTGDWPQVIEWNRRSAEAALDLSVGGAISLHYIHAMDYLVYGHLQRGEDGRARAVVEEAVGRGPYQPGFGTAFHLATIPARFAVERRAWEEASRLSPPDEAEGFPWPEGITWFAHGLGDVHTGDLAGAREAEARIAELRDRAREAGERGFATYLEIDRLVLAGRIAHAEGDAEEAVELVREAARLEGTVEKHPITPGAVLPPREALGDLLLELGRPHAALEAYRTSLEVWPGRFWSLHGAARAARAAGDEEAARHYDHELLAVAGDGEREEVRAARDRIGG